VPALWPVAREQSRWTGRRSSGDGERSRVKHIGGPSYHEKQKIRSNLHECKASLTHYE
jgi:hypothetical protein